MSRFIQPRLCKVQHNNAVSFHKFANVAQRTFFQSHSSIFRVNKLASLVRCQWFSAFALNRSDDKRSIPVLFFNNELGEKRFVVDFCDLESNLSKWVAKPGSLCSINGMMKTGKSTALMNILPPLIKRKFPDALFCKLSFDSLTPKKSIRNFLERLISTLDDRCNENGIQIRKIEKGNTVGSLSTALIATLTAIDQANKPVFFLWDEIQAWFQMEDPDGILSQLFKSVVSPTHPKYRNLHFAVTGSGMARAWFGFLQAPANGHTISSATRVVVIPVNPDASVLQLTAKILHEITGQKVPAAFMTLKNPAALSWVFYSSLELDLDPQKALQKYSEKCIEEFSQDLLPLLTEVAKFRSPKTIQHIYQLAYQVCLQHPMLIFGSLYDNFFSSFIVKQKVDPDAWTLYHTISTASDLKNDEEPPEAIPPLPTEDVWGFVDCDFTTLLRAVLKPDGSIKPLEDLFSHMLEYGSKLERAPSPQLQQPSHLLSRNEPCKEHHGSKDWNVPLLSM